MPSSSQPRSQLFSTWSSQVHFFFPPVAASPLQPAPVQPVVATSAQAGRVGSEHATQAPWGPGLSGAKPVIGCLALSNW